MTPEEARKLVPGEQYYLTTKPRTHVCGENRFMVRFKRHTAASSAEYAKIHYLRNSYPSLTPLDPTSLEGGFLFLYQIESMEPIEDYEYEELL